MWWLAFFPDHQATQCAPRCHLQQFPCAADPRWKIWTMKFDMGDLGNISSVLTNKTCIWLYHAYMYMITYIHIHTVFSFPYIYPRQLRIEGCLSVGSHAVATSTSLHASRSWSCIQVEKDLCYIYIYSIYIYIYNVCVYMYICYSS